MGFDEIVGAVIDSNTVTSNLESINASRAFGHDVRFVTRQDAQQRAKDDPAGEWSAMASGQTLFLTRDGAVYRPRVSQPGRPRENAKFRGIPAKK